MKTLILCEGKTDAIFLSYYLGRVCGWIYIPNKDAPKDFSITATEVMGESVEWYRKGDDFLLICAVGGKDNFSGFIKDKIIPAMIDSSVFSQIVVVTDRDDREELSICQSFQAILSEIVSNIENNTWIENTYQNSYKQESFVKFLLLVIPSDKEGALETILIDAISELEYDRPIVEKAKTYIDDIEPLALGYIGKRRLKLKAWLGVIWATQYPEKILTSIDKQIRSVKWEDSETLSQCFSELRKI